MFPHMVAAATSPASTEPDNTASSPIHPSTPSPILSHSPLPTAQSPLPSLPAPDEALIARFFEDESLHTLQDLFTTLKASAIEGAPPETFKTLLDLFRWSQREDIKPWLDLRTEDLNKRRAEADHAKRTLALNHLEEVLKATTDLIEKRRTASVILRTLNRTGLGALRSSNPRRASSEPRPSATHQTRAAPNINSDDPSYESHRSYTTYSSPDGHPPLSPPPSSSALPPDPYASLRAQYQHDTPQIPPPSPSIEPANVAFLAMRAALRRSRPAYLAAFNGLLAKGATFNGQPITDSNFPEFHPTGAISFGPIGPQSNYTSRIRIKSAHPPHFLLTLVRGDEPPHPNCWLISDISHDTS